MTPEKLQQILSEPVKTKRFKEAYDRLDHNKVIVNSTKDTHADGLLSAIPTVPELRLPSDLIIIAVKELIGVPIISENENMGRIIKIGTKKKNRKKKKKDKDGGEGEEANDSSMDTSDDENGGDNSSSNSSSSSCNTKDSVDDSKSPADNNNSNNSDAEMGSASSASKSRMEDDECCKTVRICRIYHCHYTDFNQHAMLCGFKKSHMLRHTLVKRAFEKFCAAASLDTEDEPAIFGFRSDGKDRSGKPKKDQKRLDTLILNFWRKGTAMGVGISMASPLAEAFINNMKLLIKIECREAAKNSKYANDYERMKIGFKPFVLDVYDGMPANIYLYLFKHISKMIEDYEAVNYAAPNAEIFWKQVFAIALWRGNAYKLKIHTNLVCCKL